MRWGQWTSKGAARQRLPAIFNDAELHGGRLITSMRAFQPGVIPSAGS